jgi:hypothetical protein
LEWIPSSDWYCPRCERKRARRRERTQRQGRRPKRSRAAAHVLEGWGSAALLDGDDSDHVPSIVRRTRPQPSPSNTDWLLFDEESD